VHSIQVAAAAGAYTPTELVDAHPRMDATITGDNTAITQYCRASPAPPAASAVNTKWADSTWSGGWVNYLVNTQKYGREIKWPTGTLGTGVAIYDLDNEPSWWDAVHRDVHPLPFTYDEVTNGGIVLLWPSRRLTRRLK